MDTPDYTEGDKVLVPDSRFKHVMAITLDPSKDYKRGIVRCITSRSGDIEIKGSVDRSVLHWTEKKGTKFEIGERFHIEGEDEILNSLIEPGDDFIGLEDPDIFVENESVHLYFTIAIIKKDKHKTFTYLGHAVGKSLDTLAMSEPVLGLTMASPGAKEVSIAPINKDGVRLNLFESRDRSGPISYSTVGLARAQGMSQAWQDEGIIFHPAKNHILWVGEHASPGPLFPKSFIDPGVGKLAGILNGREKSDRSGGETMYGNFSVGLFVYDYEKGVVDWVSPNYLIRDSEAKTITFASQFVETGPGVGTLYAHVDDSFIRAYTLNAEGIRRLLFT